MEVHSAAWVRAWENTSAACSLHSLLLQQSDTANSIPATVLFCHCGTLVTLHNSNSVVHVIVSVITLITDVPLHCMLYVFQPFSSFLYLTYLQDIECMEITMLWTHGIMGMRFTDGGLLRYRKWVPQQLGSRHGETTANHMDLQSGCGRTCVFAVRVWSNLWDLIWLRTSHYSMLPAHISLADSAQHCSVCNRHVNICLPLLRHCVCVVCVENWIATLWFWKMSRSIQYF